MNIMHNRYRRLSNIDTTASRWALLWALTVMLPAAAVSDSPPAESPAPVEVASALDCLLEPYQVVKVASPVDGILEAVLAERGDTVKEGDVIARLKAGVENATCICIMPRVRQAQRRSAMKNCIENN